MEAENQNLGIFDVTSWIILDFPVQLHLYVFDRQFLVCLYFF